MLRRTKSSKDYQGRPILVLPKKTIEIERINFHKLEGELYTVYFTNQQRLVEKMIEN